MRIKAMLGYPDGTHIMQEELTSSIERCEHLGRDLADIMIEKGALDILSEAEAIAFKDQMPQRL